jgi:hypothetical protein
MLKSMPPSSKARRKAGAGNSLDRASVTDNDGEGEVEETGNLCQSGSPRQVAGQAAAVHE